MSKVKLDQNSGPTPILSAYPVVLVGAEVNGKPNFTTVAWVGVAASNPPTIAIALQHHRYSLKGIRNRMAFSVNIPSTSQMKETDYCGLVSGEKVDKTERCGFKLFYGKPEGIPFIEQFPINHGCEVVQMVNLGSHELVVGRIVETHVSADCIVGGRLDATKLEPIFFTGGKYYALGNKLGDAFEAGRGVF